MTFIYDNPETFAETSLKGFSKAYANRIQWVTNGVVRKTSTPHKKVAVVVGGGSGHYPAFAGFVGAGMADAAVAGDVFASPSAQSVTHVARIAHRGGGIVLGFGKYAGDVMNFGLAAERLRSEGIDVRILEVSDDVASAPAEQASLRRGVAGDLAVFKIIGAAAEAGHTIDEVERIGRHANSRTISYGVAFTGCTLPGAKEPLFTVPTGVMAMGLGIHGEPGISEEKMSSAQDLAKLLVERLLIEKPKTANQRIAVILNGLGCTKYEELFVLWYHIDHLLQKAGLTIVAPEVGEFVTSLDMAGCSLTITWLDDELERYWVAPCDAPVLRRGSTIPVVEISEINEFPKSTVTFTEATSASQESAKIFVSLLENLASALREAEDELGKIDARAGDGDHGQGMYRGSAAAALAAQEALKSKAGVASLLAHAGDAWADRAGGTSGALWGLALRTWSTAFNDTTPPSREEIAEGARRALEAVKRLGQAKCGDKTMVDAFEPFVETLEKGVASGLSLAKAWGEATSVAEDAAKKTAELTPKLGRARSHAARSLGHPDAGAVSFALCAKVVESLIGQCKA